jgi:putative two-component system response regulator
VDKHTILVVDDVADNIDVLGGVLRPTYKVKAVLNGKRALEIANEQPRPDMILLDIMMPDMDGYEVIQKLKSNPATKNIPVIFVTAKQDSIDEEHGLTLGAVDYITKPISPPIIMARVATHLSLYNQNRELDRKVVERTAQLNLTRLQIIQRLGKAAEFKDNETGMHVIRMSHYSRLMADALNISDEWAELIFNAAPMHDIGKIGIPDKILLKPGKLDAEEWEIMKRHAEYGADILGTEDSELIRMAAEIAITHHEKFNGTGYPKGLKGEDIPLSGRIVAIADVFDALTSVRPYKDAWSVGDAVKLITEEAGQHFDPKLVDVFNDRLGDMMDFKDTYADMIVEEIEDIDLGLPANRDE